MAEVRTSAGMMACRLGATILPRPLVWAPVVLIVCSCLAYTNLTPLQSTQYTLQTTSRCVVNTVLVTHHVPASYILCWFHDTVCMSLLMRELVTSKQRMLHALESAHRKHSMDMTTRCPMLTSCFDAGNIIQEPLDYLDRYLLLKQGIRYLRL